MKKHIKIIALFSIVTAALLAMPDISRAQDAPASPTAPAAKNKAVPFHGKVAAVDTNAMTLTVATLNFNITSKTKITKDGQPATLSEIIVGDAITGSYKKDAAGQLNATLIRDGNAKAKTPRTGKKKKGVADTNAPAAN
ncbi:MAG TPA: hypothetical protein VIK53_11485 [Verrucomicrobiae bacterium]